jgi:anti-sigma-K factor RskA
VTEEDEQLCMSYALGTLDGDERERFEARLAQEDLLLEQVRAFETLYAEQEEDSATPASIRLKESIMSQISQPASSSNEPTQPILASQVLALLAFGAVIAVACFTAFGVSLLSR